MIVVILAGLLYVYNGWLTAQSDLQSATVHRTASAALLFDADQIAPLLSSDNSEKKRDLDIVNVKLSTVAAAAESVSEAYLIGVRDGKYYVLADSFSAQGGDKSKVSLPFTGDPKRVAEAFAGADPIRPILPFSNNWGTWITVFVPIKDAGGETTALLGLDFPRSMWEREVTVHVYQSAAIALCLVVLTLGFYNVILKNRKLRALSEQTRESEVIFRTTFEQAPVGVAIIRDHYRPTEINEEYVRILGRTREELQNLDWKDITHPADLEKDLEFYEKFLRKEIPGYSLEKRYLRGDGSYIWVLMVIAPLQYDDSLKETNATRAAHLCIIQDIHERKEAEKALEESERSKGVLLSNLPGMAYRCANDPDWTMTFMSEGCLELTGYQPESLIHNQERSFSDLILPAYRKMLWEEWQRILGVKKAFRFEYEIQTATREKKWVLEIGRGVYADDGSVEALEGIIIDITESRRQLDQIRYMNDHDFLTGLYNRKYYEEQKRRIEKSGVENIAIVTADISGVRLTNDTFGYAQGDHLIIETAKILRSCCGQDELLARTGGDEFILLMPGANLESAGQKIEQILQACERYNRGITEFARRITLSLGGGAKSGSGQTVEDAEREANDALRKRKLLERKSYMNSILSAMLATLYARSQETEHHAERLSFMSRKIGLELGLSGKDMDDLQLFTMLHDIGKIGIDDRILNKPGPLTEEEWVVMRQHPEIGYHISMSAPELTQVAEYVLSHHERWDGKGYPRALKAEQIPLAARILAVVDAYDAMTETRVYRKALPREEAIAEIKRNRGTQFDPQIVDIFLRQLEENDGYDGV